MDSFRVSDVKKSSGIHPNIAQDLIWSQQKYIVALKATQRLKYCEYIHIFSDIPPQTHNGKQEAARVCRNPPTTKERR
jgi:hypothetical protein